MKYTIKYNQQPLCEVRLEDTDQINQAIAKILDERGLAGYFDSKTMFFRVLAEFIIAHERAPDFRRDGYWYALYNVPGVEITMIEKEEFDFSKVQIEDEFIFCGEVSKY